MVFMEMTGRNRQMVINHPKIGQFLVYKKYISTHSDGSKISLYNKSNSTLPHIKDWTFYDPNDINPLGAQFFHIMG